MPISNRKRTRRHRRKPKMSLDKRIKQILFKNSESKYIDNTDTDTSLINTDDTAFMDLFHPAIAEGSTEQSRIGNQIFHKGCLVKYEMKATASHSVRFLAILVNNVGDSTARGNVNTDFDYTSVGLIGQLPREVIGYNYKVLWDQTINQDPDKNGSIVGKKYLKVNKTSQFGDASDIYRSNMILFYVYTNNTTASAVELSFNSRFFYKDI